jgi:hypothetical protein
VLEKLGMKPVGTLRSQSGAEYFVLDRKDYRPGGTTGNGPGGG